MFAPNRGILKGRLGLNQTPKKGVILIKAFYSENAARIPHEYSYKVRPIVALLDHPTLLRIAVNLGAGNNNYYLSVV
jgi:hypothetical protein